MLDSSEVSNTQYICNGSSGANGQSALVSVTNEAAGANCANGGKKIETGLDANGNSTLDAGEIDTTSYVCDGAAAGIAWVDVTGTSVVASPNTGYIAHNDSVPVTISLPAKPSFGDVVRVNGLGSGGWKIEQNDGQSIQASNLSMQAGEKWTARESARMWSSVASASDGSKLVAAEMGGQIYTSTDSGIFNVLSASGSFDVR